jgi:hypothetical protein
VKPKEIRLYIETLYALRELRPSLTRPSLKVYEVFDTEIKEKVALKLLKPDSSYNINGWLYLKGDRA